MGKRKGVEDMDSIVSYHNELNTVVMRRWTSEEMNIFISIVMRIRDRGTQITNFTFEELKQLVEYKSKDGKQWDSTIEKALIKLGQLVYWERAEQKFRVMPVFKLFEFDLNTKKLEVEVSDKYEYIFNRLDKCFTSFMLEDFLAIRSTYAKTMFRLLKQWRTVGKAHFTKDELFTILDVPESMQRSCNFNARVLAPIKKELEPLFKDLTITPIKENGNKIGSYAFTWKAEKISENKPNNFNRPKRIEPTPEWLKESRQEPQIVTTGGKDFLSSNEIEVLQTHLKELETDFYKKIGTGSMTQTELTSYNKHRNNLLQKINYLEKNSVL